jgi:hypothetical protein
MDGILAAVGAAYFADYIVNHGWNDIGRVTHRLVIAAHKS